MRRAARTDANHSSIVGGLRQCGYLVHSLASVGKGCPDLYVSKIAWRPFGVLVECKDGSKPPSARQLTDAQVEFISSGFHVLVVNGVEDALKQLHLVGNARLSAKC